MGKVSIHAEHFRELRKALGGITQAELAAKLLVSRNYISQIEASLKNPSDRLLAQTHNLLTESASTHSKKSESANPHGIRLLRRQDRAVETTTLTAEEVDEHIKTHLKSGGKSRHTLEEEQARFGGVASRLPVQRTPSTRADCEAFVQQLLDAAQMSDDPNAWPVILHRLRKQFPMDEWEQPKPEDT